MSKSAQGSAGIEHAISNRYSDRSGDTLATDDLGVQRLDAFEADFMRERFADFERSVLQDNIIPCDTKCGVLLAFTGARSSSKSGPHGARNDPCDKMRVAPRCVDTTDRGESAGLAYPAVPRMALPAVLLAGGAWIAPTGSIFSAQQSALPERGIDAGDAGLETGIGQPTVPLDERLVGNAVFAGREGARQQLFG